MHKQFAVMSLLLDCRPQPCDAYAVCVLCDTGTITASSRAKIWPLASLNIANYRRRRISRRRTGDRHTRPFIAWGI